MMDVIFGSLFAMLSNPKTMGLMLIAVLIGHARKGEAGRALGASITASGVVTRLLTEGFSAGKGAR